MLQLELKSEEAKTLREVLEDYVSDLRMEIADTENMSFREQLKAKEALLRSLIGRLGGA